MPTTRWNKKKKADEPLSPRLGPQLRLDGGAAQLPPANHHRGLIVRVEQQGQVRGGKPALAVDMTAGLP